eukprot:TRINITY_DN2369_c0_g2_i1.p1 TRINITY_DN2369_c0_g2~~TRINITY_DN2369_c0_g2_i1.p1  ORF type:complete len:897 (+),score=251.74 TRINITY_DN2369_c0_g2_i1:49-2691(+)
MAESPRSSDSEPDVGADTESSRAASVPRSVDVRGHRIVASPLQGSEEDEGQQEEKALLRACGARSATPFSGESSHQSPAVLPTDYGSALELLQQRISLATPPPVAGVPGRRPPSAGSSRPQSRVGGLPPVPTPPPGRVSSMQRSRGVPSAEEAEDGDDGDDDGDDEDDEDGGDLPEPQPRPPIPGTTSPPPGHTRPDPQPLPTENPRPLPKTPAPPPPRQQQQPEPPARHSQQQPEPRLQQSDRPPAQQQRPELTETQRNPPKRPAPKSAVLPETPPDALPLVSQAQLSAAAVTESDATPGSSSVRPQTAKQKRASSTEVSKSRPSTARPRPSKTPQKSDSPPPKKKSAKKRASPGRAREKKTPSRAGSEGTSNTPESLATDASRGQKMALLAKLEKKTERLRRDLGLVAKTPTPPTTTAPSPSVRQKRAVSGGRRGKDKSKKKVKRDGSTPASKPVQPADDPQDMAVAAVLSGAGADPAASSTAPRTCADGMPKHSGGQQQQQPQQQQPQQQQQQQQRQRKRGSLALQNVQQPSPDIVTPGDSASAAGTGQVRIVIPSPIPTPSPLPSQQTPAGAVSPKAAQLLSSIGHLSPPRSPVKAAGKSPKHRSPRRHVKDPADKTAGDGTNLRSFIRAAQTKRAKERAEKHRRQQGQMLRRAAAEAESRRRALAALAIQNWWRRLSDRAVERITNMHRRREALAARLIQRMWRGHIGRKRAEEWKKEAAELSAAEHLRLSTAALKIQAPCRGWLQRRHWLLRRRPAILGRRQEQLADRRRNDSEFSAAADIQAAWRMYCERRRFLPIFHYRRNTCAAHIQRWYRELLRMRRVQRQRRREGTRRARAILAIQCAFRVREARKEVGYRRMHRRLRSTNGPSMFTFA